MKHLKIFEEWKNPFKKKELPILRQGNRTDVVNYKHRIDSAYFSIGSNNYDEIKELVKRKLDRDGTALISVFSYTNYKKLMDELHLKEISSASGYKSNYVEVAYKKHFYES